MWQENTLKVNGSSKGYIAKISGDQSLTLRIDDEYNDPFWIEIDIEEKDLKLWLNNIRNREVQQ